VIVRGGRADWEPETAVVFVGSNTVAAAAADDACCPPNTGVCAVAAADRCCGVMNFFASRSTARDWAISHSQVSGVVLTREQALRLGVDIFGHLLDD
jgi:hypothetical protein